jgi:hypothetical protein
MLRHTCVVRLAEHESMNSWKRMSASTSAGRRSPPPHQPDLLGELGVVGLRHALDRLREAEPLEREPDRDEDLVHLLVGDAQDDGTPVGVGDDEPFVLELAERLMDGPAARRELARDALFRSAVAVLVPADHDCLAKSLEDALPARARALRPARSGRRTVGGGTGCGGLLHQRHC